MKNSKLWALLVVVCSALPLAQQSVFAQEAAAVAAGGNAIERIQAQQQAGTLYVQIHFKEPLSAVPASFSVANPARIAFDFPGTANALGASSLKLSEGELTSANVVQVGDRTRLVLNMTRMLPYQARIDGSDLIVSMTSAAAAPSVAGANATVFAAGESGSAATSGGRSVLDVNFRRGNEGEARVIVNLSDPNTPIDIQRKSGDLVVDFRGATLPEHLRKRSDVLDFATPVSEFVTASDAQGTHLKIKASGLWEHNAYQTDKQFVLEVRRIEEDPTKLVQGAKGKYSGDKLSLNFQNVDVRSILQVLADFTGFNIVTSDSVKGNLTLRLKDVPWDQALDIILDAKGLDKQKNGNVIWIAPVAELRKRELELAQLAAATMGREPLTTERFMINYHQAADVAALLIGQKKTVESASKQPGAPGVAAATGEANTALTDSAGVGMLSPRGTVTSDPRTNSIFVTDVPSNMAAIAKLIEQLDVVPKQVMIEARIVEATDSFNRDLGVRLGFGSTFSGKTVGADSAGNAIPQYSIGGAMSMPEVASPRSWAVDLPASGAANNLSMVLWNNSATRYIDLELSAMETDGRIKIVSRPRVLTANRLEATIKQGEERPYSTTSQNGTNVQFKEAVLELKVTPTITPDGKIRMTVDLKKDQFGSVAPDGSLPINKRNVKSEVMVENGGTIVMGGILDESQSDTVNKVPFLGDIPVLGYLFRNSSVATKRTELMLFITPRIVDDRMAVTRN